MYILSPAPLNLSAVQYRSSTPGPPSAHRVSLRTAQQTDPTRGDRVGRGARRPGADPRLAPPGGAKTGPSAPPRLRILGPDGRWSGAPPTKGRAGSPSARLPRGPRPMMARLACGPGGEFRTFRSGPPAVSGFVLLTTQIRQHPPPLQRQPLRQHACMAKCRRVNLRDAGGNFPSPPNGRIHCWYVAQCPRASPAPSRGSGSNLSRRVGICLP